MLVWTFKSCANIIFSHINTQSGRQICDLNTKLAEGIVHCGVSANAIIRLISLLGIPPPNHKTIKRREREVGPILEDFARETCRHAMEAEISKGREGAEDDSSGITVQ